MMTIWRFRRAFSLVEVLVVISVLVVVLALSLPALSAMFRSGAEAQSLSNLRTISQSFEMYVQRHRSYPFGQGGWAAPPETLPEDPYLLGFGPWLIDRHWPVLFHDVAPWTSHFESWLSPGADPARFTSLWAPGSRIDVTTTAMPSYRYSTSFIARPSLWDDAWTPGDATWLQASHPSQVVFPANKVLVYDHERAYLSDRDSRAARPIAHADGSALLRFDREATPPVQNPIADRPPTLYQDTPRGIHGRDF